MDSEIKIREYKTEDKFKLLRILELNVPKFFDKSEIVDFEKYLEYKLEKYFVVELNGEIIGSGGINFEDNYRIGKISWDIINPEFQGLGIGREILKYRIELLKSMTNVETILVRTSQFVYEFYEKNNFVLKEIKKDYWAKGFDMYKMIYEETANKEIIDVNS